MKLKSFNKRVSIWQYMSVALSMLMVICSTMIIVLQSIDIYFNLFSYGSFMFDFLDKYSDIFTLLLFDFGTLLSSMVHENLALNVIVTITSLLICVALAFSSFVLCKPKAKIGITVWIVVAVSELLISLFIMSLYAFYIFVFAVRFILLLCFIMSLKYVNTNYEYYD